MPQIYVSIGTNQQRRRNLTLALDSLHKTFGCLTLSPVYESVAVGFSGDEFYNMVVGFHSEELIETINRYFKQVEKLSGRNHSLPKFGNRTLDIDLLSYGDCVRVEPITLPKPEILYHAFVLKPFNDIAPFWEHPVKKQSIRALWLAFDQEQQQLHPIDNPIPMEKYQQ